MECIAAESSASMVSLRAKRFVEEMRKSEGGRKVKAALWAVARKAKEEIHALMQARLQKPPLRSGPRT